MFCTRSMCTKRPAMVSIFSQARTSENKRPNGGGVYDGDHPNASDQRSLSGTWQSFHPLKNVMNMDLVER